MKRTLMSVVAASAMFFASVAVSATHSAEQTVSEADVFATQVQPTNEQAVTKADIMNRIEQSAVQVQTFVNKFDQCIDKTRNNSVEKAYSKVAKALKQAQENGTVNALPDSYKKLYQALAFHQQLVSSVRSISKKIGSVYNSLKNGDMAYTDSQLAAVSNNVNVMLDMITSKAMQLSSCQSLNLLYQRADAVNNS